MLRQEVNLYRAFATPPTDPGFFSWRRLWQFSLIILVILTSMYLFSLWHLHYLKNEKVRLNNKSQDMQKKFLQIKNTYPQILFSQDVNDSVGKLRKEVSLQEKLLQEITNRIFFSQQLTALGKIIVPNVWLTSINIRESGRVIILKGNSVGMDNLQSFLTNISQEKLFNGYILTINNIANSKQTENIVLNFEINLAKKK